MRHSRRPTLLKSASPEQENHDPSTILQDKDISFSEDILPYSPIRERRSLDSDDTMVLPENDYFSEPGAEIIYDIRGIIFSDTT